MLRNLRDRLVIISGFVCPVILVIACVVFPARKTDAGGICIDYLAETPTEATYKFVFPNWTMAHVHTYDVYFCDDSVCTWGSGTERIVGLTIVNYGSADAGDISGVYWQMMCGKADTGVLAMTSAGVWGGQPVWTWAGMTVDLDKCPVSPAFSIPLRIYADMDPCPTEGATIALGVRQDALLSPGMPGGLTDEYGCNMPWEDVVPNNKKIITHVAKLKDRDFAAPGDTITYTIFVGQGGSVPLTSITVTDSLPAYTSWNGVASPAPDPGWAPDYGPPIRLRWTLPGGATTGGATTEITFQVTVDWGNEPFEVGSGATAAPEGDRLRNAAHVSFDGSDCAVTGFVSNEPSTVVQRYMFWMFGDNDVLLAGTVGQPDDEIIYEVTMRNMSSQKTWWNVNVWDTVPDELEVWGPGFGLWDPCVGWTITPTGCAPASAGRVLVGGKTILTWDLNLEPGATAIIRWKARVSPGKAPPNSVATNTTSVMALGFNGVNGTGHAGKPRNFTHLAGIFLRTVYVSYLAWAGADNAQAGFFIAFYPLHRAANFELRALEYINTDPYTDTGGVSASIGNYVGNCLGGFGVCGMVTAGCKNERIPATYLDWRSPNCIICDPATVGRPAEPAHFLYKLVANTPVLWSLYSAIRNTPQDQQAFTPSTSLNFSGFMHYTYRREGVSLSNDDDGDTLNIMNTSINAGGTYDPNLATTVFIFTWDVVGRVWQYFRMVNIDPDSHYATSPVVDYEPCGHYRIVSSDARLVIRQSCTYWGVCTGTGNSSATLSPTRELGTLVSNAIGQTFYLFPSSHSQGRDTNVIVGNVGTTDVTYRIERYWPRDVLNAGACVPRWMADTSGTWQFIRRDTVPFGLANPANAHMYGTLYDNAYTFPTADTDGAIWRLIQESAGALQVATGGRAWGPHAGGNMLHDDGGDMTGDVFHIFSGYSNWGACDASHAFFDWIEIFCPKAGTVVNAVSSDGYSATYTTNGPDQVVSFGRITPLASAPMKRNFRITGSEINLVAMHNQCVGNHKFFTAPFVVEGVHYNIITPPVVFVGQSFWITIIVVETAGGTKTDYCGTTKFTSTDPNAGIEGGGMNGYNYVWDSDEVAALCVGAGCPDGCDNGVKMFFKVTFSQIGLQTLIASDIFDGSITGIQAIMVVGVDVKLNKWPKLSVAASGDTVRFRICWSNWSSGTAFGFVITDAVPEGTTYLPDLASDMVLGTSGPVPAVDVAYSTSASATPPATFTTTTGIVDANSRWLRWTVRDIYINSTGCVAYRVRIN